MFSWRRAPVLLSVLLSLFGACRVQPGGGQDAADAREAGETADSSNAPEVDSNAPTARVCDLILQNCPDRQACYPDSTFSGATRCVFPGSGGPLSPCLLHEECDTRSICFDVNRDGFPLCTPLCDPAAAASGCQRGAPCRRLTNYGAGTCGL